MKDYLSLVAPNQRFYYPSTKDVLYNSILQKKSKEQFSLSKFSQAWEMLGMYAANLLGQPWRKEFREIRVNCFHNSIMKLNLFYLLIKQLYSGAFKHQIEQQLIGAEDILMTMGYTLDIEYNRLVMQSILDPDRIVIVSRDCLLAKVEAQVIRNISFVTILLFNNSIVFFLQILSEIHAGLSSRLGSCTWTDIFNFRDCYVGSVSHCIRGLLYQHHQKEAVLYSMNQPMSAGYLGPHEVYPMNNFPFPMGMMGNMGGMGAMGAMSSMGPMGNMGNMGGMAGMGGMTNMGSMGGMGSMNTMGGMNCMNNMNNMSNMGNMGSIGNMGSMSNMGNMGFPCNKMGYNYPYPLPMEQYGGYLPKTLPSDEIDLPRSHTSELLYPKSLEKHAEEPIRAWNSAQSPNTHHFNNYNHYGGHGNMGTVSGSTTLKSVPKFESNIDIDHLEQLCNEEMDNHRRRSDKLAEANGKKYKDDKHHVSEKSMYVAAHSKFSPNSNAPPVKEEHKTPVTEKMAKAPAAAHQNDVFSNGSHKNRVTSSTDEVKRTLPSPVPPAPAVPHRPNVFNGARPKEWPSSTGTETVTNKAGKVLTV